MATKDTGNETVRKNQRISHKDKYLQYYFIKIEFLREKALSFLNPELDSGNVKGRLKKRWLFWEQLGANKFIVNVIREGYKLNFESIPSEKYFKNNQSALNNVEFVNETLRELLNSGTIIEVPFQPTVVSPLSVNTRSPFWIFVT